MALDLTLFSSEEGLWRLIRERVREHVAIDYKAKFDIRDRSAYRELLRDCASLASAGVGYLVLGVDESRDGVDVPVAIVGLEDAEAVRNSVREKLRQEISPPLRSYDAWIVETTSGRVVVIEVKGRSGYPYEVPSLPQGPRHFVREGARKIALSPDEAEARRRSVASALPIRVAIAALAACIALVGFLGISSYRQRAAAFDAVDPSLCHDGRRDLGGISSVDQLLLNDLVRVDEGIRRRDAERCRAAVATLEEDYPMISSRAFFEAQCALLAGDMREARAELEHSEVLVHVAERLRPGDLCPQLLEAATDFFARGEDSSCDDLARLATSRDNWAEGTVMLPPNVGMLFHGCWRGLPVLKAAGWQRVLPEGERTRKAGETDRWAVPETLIQGVQACRR